MNNKKLKQAKSQLFLFITVSIFVCLFILFFLNEILDFSHIIFKTPITHINWIEIISKTVIVFLICSISIYIIIRLESKRKKAVETLRKTHDKNKELVEEQTAEILKTNEELKQEIQKRQQVEKENNNLIYEMGERVKELQCLYGISESIRKRNTLTEIFQDVIKYIPQGWHYPEYTRALIHFDGKDYIEQHFDKTKWKLYSDINIRGKRRGSVEVYYTKEIAELNKGPFLKEEQNLIQGIAQTLSEVIEHNRAIEENKSSGEQLHKLSARLQSIREEERENISREINVVLGQALTNLKKDLSSLDNSFPKEQKDGHKRIRELKELIEDTIKSVQKISMDLRPSILDDLGLVSAIKWEAQEFQKRFGIKCVITTRGSDSDLDENLTINIFRIFQEILTNVARHANATQVKSNLNIDDKELILEVRDNGKGIPKDKLNNPKSLGLFGMKERVYPWKGRVDIKVVEQESTTVKVFIPFSSVE